MTLYLLEPVEDLQKEDDLWSDYYGCVFGMVIRAQTEIEARKIAQKEGGFETERVDKNQIVKLFPWHDPKYTTCVELTPVGDAGLIVKDMREG